MSNANYSVSDYDLKVCLEVAGGAFAALTTTDVWVSTALSAFNTTAGTGGTNATFKWPVAAGDAFGVP